MSLTTGTRLGAYQVTALPGEGGMGQVYRARDAKLKRDVALKVLPAEVATDRERLVRFQREAEVLASLNHPSIAHIHGLEEADGVTALVMEIVEGEDLSQRIARGAIPIDEALPDHRDPDLASPLTNPPAARSGRKSHHLRATANLAS